jgi:hypothetical protein
LSSTTPHVTVRRGSITLPSVFHDRAEGSGGALAEGASQRAPQQSPADTADDVSRNVEHVDRAPDITLKQLDHSPHNSDCYGYGDGAV